MTRSADPHSPPQAVAIASVAAREKRTERSIRQTLPLAFPDSASVATAPQGQSPRGFRLERRLDLAVAWLKQWTRLGFEAPARP